MIKKIKSKFGYKWQKFFDPKKTQVKEFEKISKYLAYSKIAKQFIRAHPKLISNFLKMRNNVINGGKQIEGNLVLENLSREVRGNTATRFFRLLINGQPFFIKEIERKNSGRMFFPKWDSPEFQIQAL